jgi:outer membrane immunogenic protein
LGYYCRIFIGERCELSGVTAVKHVAIAGAFICLFTGSAFAANPKAPAPVFSWTGCYFGADVGASSDKQQTSINAVNVNQGNVSSALTEKARAVGGGFAGCNYQFSPVVLGAEADFSFGTFGGNANGPNLFPSGAPAGGGGIFWQSHTSWLATARGRLGVAVIPNLLLYGTGGIAWRGADYSGADQFNNPTVLSTQFGDERVGTVFGAGAEWAPWSNYWIFRIEYLHYQFRGISSTAMLVPGSFTTFNFGDLKIDTVRAGVGVKF